MKKRFAFIVVFVAVLACSFAFAQGTSQDEKAKIQAATEAAQKWLKLVDDGKYAESWDETAAMFKEKVTKEQWIGAMQQVRAPLGTAKPRTLKGATYMTKLPGVPDGEYVVIQLDSSYVGLSGAVDTVTPMKDKDGKWRVSGYFIKPADK